MSDASLHRRDLAALVACAQARVRFPELSFADPMAEEILERLDVPKRTYDERELRGLTLLSATVDALARDFFARHPEGIGVALCPGLCTRFSRIDNGSLRWIDLDTPEVVALKRGLYLTPDRHVIATACSSCCPTWLSHLEGVHDVPLLVVAGESFSRMPRSSVDRFVTRFCAKAPSGTEWLLTVSEDLPARPSRSRMLEIPGADGTVAKYPRARFVSPSSYPLELEAQVAGLSGISRLFRGRGLPHVAHLVLR